MVNIDQQHGNIEQTQLNRRNNPEHGIHGVDVGLPSNSAGWLVYIPSTGRVLVSNDVVFDEDYLSMVSYTQTHVPGGVLTQSPSHSAFHAGQDIITTEDPVRFSSNEDAPGFQHQPDQSDAFIESSKHGFQIPMEEYYTDNLLPLLEGEGSKNSELSNPDSSPPIMAHKEEIYQHYVALNDSKHYTNYIMYADLNRNILVKFLYSGTVFKLKLNILNLE